MEEIQKRRALYPLVLMSILILIWIISWHNAYMKTLLYLETVGMIILLSFFILTYRKFRLNNLSYTLIFFYLSLHAIGVHYSYDFPENSWLSSIIRYDKLVHFSFGLFMYYPFKNAYLKLTKTVKALEYFIPLLIIMAIGASYELWEFLFTLINPHLGFAYTSFGNDIWDTQKDMSCSFIGASISSILNFIIDKIRSR